MFCKKIFHGTIKLKSIFFISEAVAFLVFDDILHIYPVLFYSFHDLIGLGPFDSGVIGAAHPVGAGGKDISGKLVAFRRPEFFGEYQPVYGSDTSAARWRTFWEMAWYLTV